MKKIILISVLIALVIPIISLAVEPMKCCETGRKVKWSSGEIVSRVASPLIMIERSDGTEIDCSANPCTCTKTDPCFLKKDHTIGSTGSGVICSQTSLAPDYGINEWAMVCLIHTMYTVTDWIFLILITLVGIMIVWGGINIVTAAGDPEKVKSGKSYIVYAAIGLAVALLSRVIPTIVESLLGM